jgi:hypothetical protein
MSNTIFDLVQGGASIVYGHETSGMVVTWNGAHTLVAFSVSGDSYYATECRTMHDKPASLEKARDEAQRFLSDLNVVAEQEFEDIMEDEEAAGRLDEDHTT